MGKSIHRAPQAMPAERSTPCAADLRGGNGSPVLSVRGLSVSFGGVHAVKDMTVEIHEGRVSGLIGPNGAGKTTFVDGVSGFVPARGVVTLDGREIQGMAAHKRVRAGLGRTFQRADALRDLTVMDLLRVSAHGDLSVGHGNGGHQRDLLQSTIELLALESHFDKTLSELPAGTRRLVSVAAAVAVNPKVIMLDEPAAGVSTEETEELTRAIHFLRDKGLGLLLVDHNVGFVSRTCDYIYMMHLGELRFEGSPEEMHQSEVVESIYLGRAADS